MSVKKYFFFQCYEVPETDGQTKEIARQRFVQYGGNKSRFANQNLNISTHAAFLYFSRLVRPVWHWNITISRRGNFIDPLFFINFLKR